MTRKQWVVGRSRPWTSEGCRVAGAVALWCAAVLIGTGVNSVAKAADPETPEASTEKTSKLRSAEDGALDLSEFIDEAYGFVPLAVPITEPAVGYGAGGGLVFIDKPKAGEGKAGAGFARPNITAVGGMATENGTWGAFAGDVRYWKDGRVQTLVGGIYASVNLDFYGVGEDSALESNPLRYNLEPVGGLVQSKWRIGESRSWIGLGYAYASTQVGFSAPDATPGLPDYDSASRVAGLLPTYNFDSRDNVFTPGAGSFFEASAGVFSENLGGSDEFQRVNVIAMHYLPLRTDLVLGVRGVGTFSFGDVPFYLRPFVNLRGVAAMRLMGEHVGSVETELRWQFYKRYSMIGFVGTGATWTDFEQVDNTRSVVAGGAGFRYEIARKYGLHMGLDVAWGPDDPIFYIQFGSAWMRP